jgi:hypothetical protein
MSNFSTRKRASDKSPKDSAYVTNGPSGALHQDTHNLAPDHLLLKEIKKIISGLTIMPIDALGNVLVNNEILSPRDARDLAKLDQIKTRAVSNFAEIWQDALILLSTEIKQILEQLEKLSFRPDLTTDTQFLKTQAATKALMLLLGPSMNITPGSGPADSLLHQLAEFHQSFNEFIQSQLSRNPYLSAQFGSKSIGHADNSSSLLRNSDLLKNKISERFKEYATFFKTLENNERESQLLSVYLGIELKYVRELHCRWSSLQIKEAMQVAATSGLGCLNVYHILISTQVCPESFPNCLALIKEAGQFQGDLLPIENRLRPISPKASPAKFSTHEDLLEARKIIENIRSHYNSDPDTSTAMRRVIAHETITKVLSEAKLLYAPHAAALLVYSYAGSIKGVTLYTSLTENPHQIKIDHDALFKRAPMTKIDYHTLREGFRSLLHGKILVENSDHQVKNNRSSDTSKVVTSVASRATGDTAIILNRIRPVLDSLHSEEKEFIKAVDLAERVASKDDSTKPGLNAAKNRPQRKNFDISSSLKLLREQLSLIQPNLADHLTKKIRDRLHTELSAISKQFDAITSELTEPEKSSCKTLLQIIKPQIISTDYASTGLLALHKICEILRIEAAPVQQNSEPTISDNYELQGSPSVSVHVSNDLSQDYMSEVTAESLADIYTHMRLRRILENDGACSALAENIAALYQDAFNKYLFPSDFTVKNKVNYVQIIIKCDGGLISDESFFELCGSIVESVNSDLPVIITIDSQRSLSTSTNTHYISEDESTLSFRAIPLNTDTTHISLTLETPDSNCHLDQDSQISKVDLIKQLLKIKSVHTWLDIEASEKGVLLKPCIPLPNGAIEWIQDQLILLQIPVYLDQPPRPIRDVTWDDVKSIIKISLPPTASIKDFRLKQDGEHYIVKIAADREDQSKLSKDLKELEQSLKLKGMHLQHRITSPSRAFYEALRKFNPKIKKYLLKARGDSEAIHLVSKNPRINGAPKLIRDSDAENKDYVKLTNARIIEGPNVFTIDPVSAGLCEDAVSVEVTEGRVLIGIHAANGAFLAPPDSLNRVIAYDRCSSIYQSYGPHFAMIPQLKSAGYTRTAAVPSISLLISVRLVDLLNPAQADPDRIFSFEVLPTLVKIATNIRTNPDNQTIVSEQNQGNSIEFLKRFVQKLIGTKYARNSASLDYQNIDLTLKILLQLFSHKTIEKVDPSLPLLFTGLDDSSSLQQNYRFKSLPSKAGLTMTRGTLNETSGFRSYAPANKALRDLRSLVAQHQLMASMGFYKPLNYQQVETLMHRENDHMRQNQSLRRDLELFTEINDLQRDATLLAKVCNNRFDSSQRPMIMPSNFSTIRNCYLISHSAEEPARSESSFQVTFRHYDIIEDAFYFEAKTRD